MESCHDPAICCQHLNFWGCQQTFSVQYKHDTKQNMVFSAALLNGAKNQIPLHYCISTRVHQGLFKSFGLYANHCMIFMDFLSLSFVFFRYYMAWKASKTQIAKPKVIMRIIIGGISFQIFFTASTILIQNWSNMTSEPITCSNLEHTVSIKTPYNSILALIELTVVVHFGLVCDVLLYFLMKQRNTQLIQWKSSQDQLAVPIKATLVSSVSLLMILICGPMCFTSWYSGKMLLWLGVILGCVWIVGHVPALLFFTISHQKKVEQIQPPIELQFHGENSNFDNAKNPQLPLKEMKLYQQRTSIFMVEEALPNQII